MSRRCTICMAEVDLTNPALRMFSLLASRMREDVSGAVRHDRAESFGKMMCGGCLEELRAHLVTMQNRHMGTESKGA